MNKKYLSALLFGALTIVSTGTFTSCKDYDDDIENLQNQINSNKDAIEKLQTLVGDGNFVKSVVKSGDKLVVTMSKGTPVEIELGSTEAGSVVTIDKETGKISIDGKETDFFAVKDANGNAKVPYINEEGELITFDAEGKEVHTGIKKNETVAVANADGSYTLSIPGNDGKLIKIELPSPASVIKSILVKEDKVLLEKYGFNWQSATGLKAEKWPGTKTILANGTNIVVPEKKNKLDVTITPFNVDATTLEFSLMNSKLVKANNIAFSVVNNKGLQYGEQLTKSVSSNGKYSLAVKPVIFEEDTENEEYNAFAEQFVTSVSKEDHYVSFALQAGAEAHSDYVVSVNTKDGDNVETLKVSLEDAVTGAPVTDNTDLKLNTMYRVVTDNAARTYDIYSEISAQEKVLFGIVEGEEPNTFKITKDNDLQSKAEFKINVQTVNIQGKHEVHKALTCQLTQSLSSAYTYKLQTLVLDANPDNAQKNFIKVDLQEMRDSMGATNVALWETNVKARKLAFYKATPFVESNLLNDQDGNSYATTLLGGDGMTILDEVKEEVQKSDVFGSDAKFLKFSVGKIDDPKFTLGQTVYAKVDFTNIEGSITYNTVIVPIQLTAPTLADQFEPAEGFVKDGVVNAYFYKLKGKKENRDVVEMSYIFNKFCADATYTADNTTKVADTDKTANDLVKISKADKDQTFELNEIDNVTLGYGHALTIKAAKNNYMGWRYAKVEEGEYIFKIRLASPIYDGSVYAVDAKEITLHANDVNAEGALMITKDMIKGADYAENEYNVVPDVLGVNDINGYHPAWSNEQIEEVKLVTEGKYLKDAKVVAVSKEGDNVIEGGFSVKTKSVVSTCKDVLKVVVSDKWGYSKSFEINVTIEK